MQKSGAGRAYQGNAALPASDLERWAPQVSSCPSPHLITPIRSQSLVMRVASTPPVAGGCQRPFSDSEMTLKR